MFPVLLAIIVTWIYGIIMTEAGAYRNASEDIQKACRTDQTSVLQHAPWIRFPYPGQFGWPIFNMPNTIVMLSGALSAMVESVAPSSLPALRPHLALRLAGLSRFLQFQRRGWYSVQFFPPSLLACL